MAGESSPPAAAASSPPAARSPPAGSPPAGSPPETSAEQTLLPGQHWVDAANQPPEPDDDGDSAVGDDDHGSSTASLSSSVLHYRTINGRTFHSERGNAQYWAANDDRQNESMDIHHHLFTLALDDKLYRAPLKLEKVKKVLDIGTGTGIWAIDFADATPSASIIGTDVSPIQPGWVPPNLEFVIEDCTQLPWTFDTDSFDYVHLRYLVGSIVDWPAFFKEAYRVCKPGGWIESHEANTRVRSNNNNLPERSALSEFTKFFKAAEEKLGRPFNMIDQDIQKQGIEAAGFVDIDVHDIMVPMCGWPADPRLKEMGRFYELVLKTDMEGYTHFIASELFGWTNEQVVAFCAQVKHELRLGKSQPYYHQRVVCARKPE